MSGFIRNVEAVLARTTPDMKIIPGHGALATPKDLKTFHAMLLETTKIVRGHLDAGKSLDDTKKAGLPEKWNSWGGGFINLDRWITIVYNSYAKEKAPK